MSTGSNFENKDKDWVKTQSSGVRKKRRTLAHKSPTRVSARDLPKYTPVIDILAHDLRHLRSESYGRTRREIKLCISPRDKRDAFTEGLSSWVEGTYKLVRAALQECMRDAIAKHGQLAPLTIFRWAEARAVARSLVQQINRPSAEDKRHEKLWALMGERIASFDVGPLLWLTQHTATEDNHWMAKGTPPVAPFPKKQYFAVILKLILESPRIFIPKSREMMTSWLVCGYIAWMCQWFPYIEWILQTEKEDKAKELVNYVRILYQRQVPWMSERVRVTTDNATELVLSNGSHILAVPKGANQVRLFHPHGYLMDEASFLPEAQQCYDTVAPVARQIIAVSSAGPGWFADQCQQG